MARTISNIYNEIILSKQAVPELSELSSDSKVSVWRLIVYVVAVAIWTQEVLQDIYRNDVEDYVSRSRVHTKRWYRDRVLEFQDGKDLNWIDGVFSYSELLEDEDIASLTLVKQAAVVEAPNELLIKIATYENGQLEPVTEEQKDRVSVYMNEIKDAGNYIRIINLPADELKITGVIYVDPLLINTNPLSSNYGALVSDSTIKPIEVAANEYINSENNRNFNGEFRITHFINMLEDAEGIKDPVITSVEARYGSLPFEEVNVSYLPNSGYHNIIEMNLEYRPYAE